MGLWRPRLCICHFSLPASSVPGLLSTSRLSPLSPNRVMKRRLTWYDLIAFGTGGMLGAGVFVTNRKVGSQVIGLLFSFLIIAGVSVVLSSMCYSEFSISIPTTGGAFSYLKVTFGYFASANILMKCLLSNAAVTRSFSLNISLSILT